MPSLLRGFTAPAKLDAHYSDDDLAVLMAYDRDVTRWDAGQRLSSNILLALVRDHAEGRAAGPLDSGLVAAFAANLDRVDEDPALAARALSLPGSGYLGQQMAVIDVEGIRHAIDHVRDQLGTALRDRWLAAYRAHVDEGPYSLETAAMARRSLKNLPLASAHAATPGSPGPPPPATPTT